MPEKVVELVIFDLDGTLIDSAEDIARAVNELRASLDHAPLALEDIRGYIGDGVGKLLERSFPEAKEELIERAREMYLPIYRRRLLDHTEPYPGVIEALAELDEYDCTLSVLTNKPLRESLLILEGLDLRRYFRTVLGGDSFERRKPDPVGVRHLLEETGSSPDQTLFVGDSHIDLETAKNASVRCCLVTYGLGPPAAASDFAKASSGLEPDFYVDDLRELAGIVGAAQRRRP